VLPPIRNLVLLPGMDGTGDLFKGFVEALPTEFDATVVRYPADVPLSCEQLKNFVRQAFPATDPFVLIAESFSTPLAIQCAALNPPNLKGLVLCAGFATSPAHGLKRLILPSLAGFALRASLPDFVTKALLLGSNAPVFLVQAVQRTISQVRPEVLSARLRSILAYDAKAELKKVNVPILYLHATHDRLVPARCLEEILEIKPDAKAISIPGPHLLFQREPQKTARAVEDFIRELEL
jgi:pimeloyl-[acyl-carrier protein] methyl ester esterase